MSADLWAAFGNDEDATSNPWSQPSPTEQGNHPSHTESRPQSNTLVELGAGRPVEHHVAPPIQSPWATETTFSSTDNRGPAHATQTGFVPTTEDEEELSWSDFSVPHGLADPWVNARTPAGTEVLWDAEQVDEGDDFGDFEDGKADVLAQVSNLRIESDLADVHGRIAESDSMSMPALLPQSTSSRGRSTQQKLSLPEFHATASLGQSMNSVRSTQKTLPAQSRPLQQTRTIDQQPDDAEEQWDEWSPDPVKSSHFSVGGASRATDSHQPASTTNTPGSSVTGGSTSPPSRVNPGVKEPSPSRSRQRLPPISTLPPTNVPPPSILISLLSTLISSLPAQVEKAMIAFTTNAESNAAADKALSIAVRKCLAALRVAARIVAGRKLRWKRDTHLSQSMRIGPAAAGGKGGMKLSGLDRSEIKREDREVAEFVRIWQAKLGSVRRALANVNAKIGDGQGSSGTISGTASKKLELPIIAQTMVVRTLKEDDNGGVRSVKACTLCGVKREERVDKVDGADVFDIASEWWVEHWGHAECRAFWYQHERYLQQR